MAPSTISKLIVICVLNRYVSRLWQRLFYKDWDELLISQLQTCERMSKSTKCIISTYPTGYDLPNTLPSHPVPTLLCAKEFGSQAVGNEQYDMLRICGRVAASNWKKPVKGLFWAAGYSFSRGSLLKDGICCK